MYQYIEKVWLGSHTKELRFLSSLPKGKRCSANEEVSYTIKKVVCRMAFIIFMTVCAVMFLPSGGSRSVQAVSENLKVHYIDVGQSDCVLISQKNKNMLVDAGDVGDGDKIVAYLRSQGVKKLDYVIATHPHADHIGGMEEVLDRFPVGKVIMSKKTHTTKTYVNLLKKIQAKGMKITEAKPGVTYKLGQASFTLLAPNSYRYGSNINDYSVAFRLLYHKNSFMFVGDCEEDAIADIMENGMDIRSDVLMCGHHGSANSTTPAWVAKVRPSYAVMSVGAGNSYGHPADSVLRILSDRKVKYFRTDKKGTIIASSNGKKITFNAKPSADKIKLPASGDPSSQKGYVYITNSGKKYHRQGCRYLSKSSTKKKLSEVKKAGYSACRVCIGNGG